MKPKTASTALLVLTVLFATARAQESASPEVKERKQRLALEQLALTQRELFKVKSDIRRLQVDAEVEKGAQRNPVPDELFGQELQQDPEVQQYQQQLDQIERILDDLQKTNPKGFEALSRGQRAEQAKVKKALEERRQRVRSQTENKYRERLQRAAAAREDQLVRLQGLARALQKELEDATVATKPAATPSPVGETLVVRVYALREFTDGEALLRVITTTIQPQSWAERGGAATAVYFGEAKSLVIKQSAEAHKGIQELLSALRDAKLADRPK